MHAKFLAVDSEPQLTSDRRPRQGLANRDDKEAFRSIVFGSAHSAEPPGGGVTVYVR
ncbi:MAG: hypothetical protein R3C53_09125 [Pirellulaceae bacterium]